MDGLSVDGHPMSTTYDIHQGGELATELDRPLLRRAADRADPAEHDPAGHERREHGDPPDANGPSDPPKRWHPLDERLPGFSRGGLSLLSRGGLSLFSRGG